MEVLPLSSEREELHTVKKNALYLSDFLKSYRGQQALIIETYETIVKSGDASKKDWVTHTMHRRFGVLTKTPTFKDSMLTIPMDFYVERGGEAHDYHHDKIWKNIKGPLVIKPCSLLNLDKKLELSTTREAKLEDLTNSLEVCAGERNIALYFTLNKPAFDLAQQKYRERILSEQELEHTGSTEGVLDLRYVYALNLLGIKPPMFLKGRIDKEKRWIIENLVHNPTLVNTEKLNEALLLGLHREDTIADFGNGIMVDVPKYITGLCGKNNITIPE